MLIAIKNFFAKQTIARKSNIDRNNFLCEFATYQSKKCSTEDVMWIITKYIWRIAYWLVLELNHTNIQYDWNLTPQVFWYESLSMMVVYILYIVLMIYNEKIEEKALSWKTSVNKRFHPETGIAKLLTADCKQNLKVRKFWTLLPPLSQKDLNDQ